MPQNICCDIGIIPLGSADEAARFHRRDNAVGQITHGDFRSFYPIACGHAQRAIGDISLPSPIHRLVVVIHEFHSLEIRMGFSLGGRDKNIICYRAIFGWRAIGVLAVVEADNQCRAASRKGVESDEGAFCSHVEIVLRAIHHRNAKRIERVEQVVDHHLIRTLQAHAPSAGFAVAKKEVFSDHIPIAVPKHQRAPAVSKRISAEDIAIGFYRDDLRLAVAAFKKVVFDEATTIARRWIVGIFPL